MSFKKLLFDVSRSSCGVSDIYRMMIKFFPLLLRLRVMTSFESITSPDNSKAKGVIYFGLFVRTLVKKLNTFACASWIFAIEGKINTT